MSVLNGNVLNFGDCLTVAKWWNKKKTLFFPSGLGFSRGKLGNLWGLALPSGLGLDSRGKLGIKASFSFLLAWFLPDLNLLMCPILVSEYTDLGWLSWANCGLSL